jgi:23S rRNA-/tRNA-specific pseudouridylate synthase
LAHLPAQFKQRTVSKSYRTFVHQTPRFDTEMVDEAIEPDPRMPDRRRVARPDIAGYLSPKSRSAQTMVKAITRYSRACELLCQPKTGRTHQIRVHLLHLGMPIIGDRTYRWPGALPNPLGDDAPIPGRPALHAASLEFEHPTTGERLKFEAPLPEDLLLLQTWLQEHWPV